MFSAIKRRAPTKKSQRHRRRWRRCDWWEWKLPTARQRRFGHNQLQWLDTCGHESNYRSNWLAHLRGGAEAGIKRLRMIVDVAAWLILGFYLWTLQFVELSETHDFIPTRFAVNPLNPFSQMLLHIDTLAAHQKEEALKAPFSSPKTDFSWILSRIPFLYIVSRGAVCGWRRTVLLTKAPFRHGKAILEMRFPYRASAIISEHVTLTVIISRESIIAWNIQHSYHPRLTSSRKKHETTRPSVCRVGSRKYVRKTNDTTCTRVWLN